MSSIDQARDLLKEPKPGTNPWMALLAAALCAMSTTLFAGAMLFGQLT